MPELGSFLNAVLWKSTFPPLTGGPSLWVGCDGGDKSLGLTSLCVPGRRGCTVKGASAASSPGHSLVSVRLVALGKHHPHLANVLLPSPPDLQPAAAEKPCTPWATSLHLLRGRSSTLFSRKQENRKSWMTEMTVFVFALPTHPYCVETSTDSSRLYSCTVLICSDCRIWSQCSHWIVFINNIYIMYMKCVSIVGLGTDKAAH